jgi:creatinine amidohydrolase
MLWLERTFPELDPEHGAEGPRVAILPLGAIEAHGPHLPVGTDVWISEGMARAGCERLNAESIPTVVLPSLAYAPSHFANSFPGTISIRAGTLRSILLDVGEALARRGLSVLALVNSHFDPAQVAAVRTAADELRGFGGSGLRVAFPDLTRRKLADRLSEEFRSGACHAGRYETSILLAERPDLVREAARAMLPPLPVSLVEAIRDGRSTFEDAGLPLAYCGDPAAARAEEGRALLVVLGEILAESVRAELG